MKPKTDHINQLNEKKTRSKRIAIQGYPIYPSGDDIYKADIRDLDEHLPDEPRKERYPVDYQHRFLEYHRLDRRGSGRDHDQFRGIYAVIGIAFCDRRFYR